ncbi:hypothetical protein [Streptomyces sp. GZWMJZ-114]|uniref:hypothetical protein n=1 Tax=Streptomyces sp. GZWMJZ-114 TaxID=2494734 RepID=UPI001010E8F4|nr:hypothetical protein [Streptomyces sp. GZWMJZ-114]
MSSDLTSPPALALEGSEIDEHLEEFVAFYREVHKESAVKREEISRRFRARLRSLVPDDVPDALLDPSEVFDPRSGAVRLREWEVVGEQTLPATRRLFGLSDESGVDESWLMHMRSDTAILLRGALYYIPYTARSADLAPRYLAAAGNFLGNAERSLDELGAIKPDVVSFKYVAALYDVTRSILLHGLTASFLVETDRADIAYPVTRRALDVALHHITCHRSFLFNDQGDWQQAISGCRAAMSAILGLLEHADDSLGLQELFSEGATAYRFLRERHSDDFLENLASVELGLADLLDSSPQERVVCVGLASGGTEFCLIAASILQEAGLNHAPMLMRLSLYQESENRRRYQGILEGTTAGAAVDRTLFPGPVLGSDRALQPSDTLIIFDDNIMTGRTLQIATELLATQGRVAGSVVARYPGFNMHSHMREHGSLNPKELLRSVRGLTSAMPAGRPPGGLIHKGEQRITDYLERGMRNVTA